MQADAIEQKRRERRAFEEEKERKQRELKEKVQQKKKKEKKSKKSSSIVKEVRNDELEKKKQERMRKELQREAFELQQKLNRAKKETTSSSAPAGRNALASESRNDYINSKPAINNPSPTYERKLLSSSESPQAERTIPNIQLLVSESPIEKETQEICSNNNTAPTEDAAASNETREIHTECNKLESSSISSKSNENDKVTNLPLCFVCCGAITGKYLQNKDGKKVHQGCIPGGGMCSHCGEKILGAKVTVNQISWHTDCFKCMKCKKDLYSSFILSKLKKAYCSDCFSRKSRPKVKKTEKA